MMHELTEELWKSGTPLNKHTDNTRILNFIERTFERIHEHPFNGISSESLCAILGITYAPKQKWTP